MAAEKNLDHECVVCGKHYKTSMWFSRYCGDKCRTKYNNEWTRQARKLLQEQEGKK